MFRIFLEQYKRLFPAEHELCTLKNRFHNLLSFNKIYSANLKASHQLEEGLLVVLYAKVSNRAKYCRIKRS